jgi:hypothetical protein
MFESNQRPGELIIYTIVTKQNGTKGDSPKETNGAKDG